MCSDKDREIDQLCFVSQMYYEMAQSIEIPQQYLQLTVKELGDRCKEHKGFRNHKSLIHASAHLNSCAVRLYSIEECIFSKRFENYDDIRKCKDEEKIRQEINKSTEQYIHFLLRHMVAHCELKRLDFPKYKTAYSVMYDTYLIFSFALSSKN